MARHVVLPHQSKSHDLNHLLKALFDSLSNQLSLRKKKSQNLVQLMLFACNKLLLLIIITGVLLLPVESIQEVYDGIWGYNAVIATSSITCVFFACNSMSILLGTANLLGTICLQYALRATITLQVCTTYYIYSNRTSTTHDACRMLN